MALGQFIFKDLPDGGCEISYEDVGEETDCEVIYKLTRYNRLKLEVILHSEYIGSLPEMIIAEFGSCLEKKPFGISLSSQGIQYETFSWYS